jgi:hypothetical protein
MTASAKEITFADLIRQREAQQRRIREALEAQNRSLRERLGFGNGPIGDGTPGIPAEEFVQFVSDLRELISKGQEADIAAFHSLRDRVDVQNTMLEQRISELEARLASSEQARDLMREEQANQSLTLSGEIDELRAHLDAAVKRFESRDDVLTEAVAAIRALNETATTFDRKFAEIEAETSARIAEVVAIEKRFEELRLQNKQEQSDLSVLRNDTLKEQQHIITTLISDAAEQLAVMKNNADALIEDTRHHHSIIGSLVDERIEPLRAELDAHYRKLINTDLQHYLEHYTAAGAEQIAEAHAAKVSLLHLETSVKLALQQMREKYSGEVDRQLKEVIDHAKAIEAERRLDFPTTDSERVEMMVKELEGGFVMLEGIIRNNVTQHRSCPLLPRVEALEAKADELEVKTSLEHQPRIMFTVESQTSLQPPALDDPVERVQSVVERHLKYELDVAAAEASARTVPLVVDRTLQLQQRSSSSSPGGTVGTLPGVSAISSQRSLITSLQEAKVQKEAAVSKVQAVLREIQAKFQELTTKDPGTTGRSSSADAKKIAALIARQKEAVYQKERQLVDQRNKLWREIADLEDRIASCP